MRESLRAVTLVLALLMFTASTYVRNVLDVIDYGARPDDSSDDGATIQRCINAAAADSGGTVYIPEGTYYLTAASCTVKTNIHIRGVGPGGYYGTVISPRGNFAAFVIDQTKATEQWSISDLEIWGTGTTTYTNQHGIAIVADSYNSSKFVIDNVKIRNCGSCGIYLWADPVPTASASTNSGLFHKVYSTNNYGYSLFIQGRHIFHQFWGSQFDQGTTGRHTNIEPILLDTPLATGMDSIFYYPSVCIVDTLYWDGDADDWGVPNSMEFMQCAIQNYLRDVTDTLMGMGVYLGNFQQSTGFEQCWFEGNAISPCYFRPIYKDTSRVVYGGEYDEGQAVSIIGCSFQQADSVYCFESSGGIDHFAWLANSRQFADGGAEYLIHGDMATPPTFLGGDTDTSMECFKVLGHIVYLASDKCSYAYADTGWVKLN